MNKYKIEVYSNSKFEEFYAETNDIYHIIGYLYKTLRNVSSINTTELDVRFKFKSTYMRYDKYFNSHIKFMEVK